jgi:hypothetical protein
MFSSWDDVWYRDKVSNAVRAMQSLEAMHGPECPLLIHTDVRMVDANLHELFPSASRHLGLRPLRKATVGRFCLENTAFGCSLIVNRSLLELGVPIPKQAGCEDQWLALIAAALGIIQCVPQISMDWRRHGANDSSLPKSLFESLRSLLAGPRAYRDSFYGNFAAGQPIVGAFLERFQGRLSESDQATAKAFLSLQHLGFWRRRHAILKYRIFYSSWARTAGLLLLV